MLIAFVPGCKFAQSLNCQIFPCTSPLRSAACFIQGFACGDIFKEDAENLCNNGFLHFQCSTKTICCRVIAISFLQLV
eukprot:16937_5